MQKAAIALSTLVLLSASADASAAGMMKPGLWEMTTKSDAMRAMPKLTPEQMEKMKAAGINLPHMNDGAMSIKVCISKEMAERDHPPSSGPRESGCEPKNFERHDGGYSMDLVCSGPNMQGEGKVKGTFSNTDGFTSVYDFKGTARGHPVNQHVETSGKFISADCGSVKPAGDYLKK